MDSSLFHIGVQRASWENIVSIETPVRRTVARMVGRVWPRLCWGKPRAAVPRASRARTASTRLLTPALCLTPAWMGAPATCLAGTPTSVPAKSVLQVTSGTQAHTFLFSAGTSIWCLLDTIIWFFRVPLCRTCLSLWKELECSSQLSLTSFWKGRKRKQKGQILHSGWLPEVYVSELGIMINSLSLEEKLLVLLITYSLKTSLSRHSGHWLFWFSKPIVSFASLLPCPCPHAFNFCSLELCFEPSFEPYDSFPQGVSLSPVSSAVIIFIPCWWLSRSSFLLHTDTDIQANYLLHIILGNSTGTWNSTCWYR